MKMFRRPRQAFWSDLRFPIGIALVLLSIAGVWLVLTSSTVTAPVLQASRTIMQGEILASGDFQIVEVSLGSVTPKYLAPQDLQPGAVASRTLVAGELVPTSAAIDGEKRRTTTVVIESTTGIPEGVGPGTVVDLWHAPPLDEGRTFDVPRILVADVVVSSVSSADGVLPADDTTVEVVVDRSDVADLLAAITGKSALSVVPIGSTP
jgi:Flp pilus assembly protein TadG